MDKDKFDGPYVWQVVTFHPILHLFIHSTNGQFHKTFFGVLLVMAARGVYYSQKSILKLTPGPMLLALFTAWPIKLESVCLWQAFSV